MENKKPNKNLFIPWTPFIEIYSGKRGTMLLPLMNCGQIKNNFFSSKKLLLGPALGLSIIAGIVLILNLR